MLKFDAMLILFGVVVDFDPSLVVGFGFLVVVGPVGAGVVTWLFWLAITLVIVPCKCLIASVNDKRVCSYFGRNGLTKMPKFLNI